ncbi:MULTISPECIES: helix-turn-helix domain-containing protein [Lactobacillaceae]|uniref:Helix-turn-helix transcriptional regulator n=1 Tax=Stutzerimonas stutzeri TaxID=316 RepID=A0AA40V9N7_STUST|nr:MULTISPECIES: helix-turn-helix transcriptional regulator [Lactobacillaceae]MBA1307527.1 helix-turn-helix transcriptional regulator [Stutzerimonas stutzeri]KAA8346343.1 helix-turn-helix transcriptional regulator [Leuconostoc mesenteroides]MBE4726732.1 helix-turn-helix transcriptional regulator [Leuconostoc citreum]MCO6184584.1 helix-turn-helix domain-containing protein [Leuconostoc fallax]WJM74231.1 helix-turn-helix transcriptional regulator [Leuconostoc mesenteroides]
MQLGEKIKHLRQSNKMSQSDLAKSLHVSYQAISNWERNKSYPDKENIIMISNLFNIPLDELMRDEQKYTPRSNSLIKYNLQNIVILIGAFFIVPSMIFLSNELSMLGLLLGFSIISFSDYIVEFIRNFKN